MLRPLVETVWRQIAGEATIASTGADMVQEVHAMGEDAVIYQALTGASMQEKSLQARMLSFDNRSTFKPELTVIPGRLAPRNMSDLTTDRHSFDSESRQSGADSAHALPADLRQLLTAWPSLPLAVQQQILALARQEESS